MIGKSTVTFIIFSFRSIENKQNKVIDALIIFDIKFNGIKRLNVSNDSKMDIYRFDHYWWYVKNM